MRIPFGVLLPALALAAAGLAQEPAPKPPKSEAQQEYDALNQDFMKARSAWMQEEARKAREAATADGMRRAIRMVPTEVIEEFVPRFEAAAAKYAKTDDAVRFHLWLLTSNPGSAPAKAALATLLSDHLESEQMEGLMLNLPRLERALGQELAADAIAKVVAATPHAKVKGAVLFARANAVLSGRDVTEEDKEAALADVRKALELAPDAGWAGRARGQVFEAENLQVGMTAPDIEGSDLDGVAFKLSDYRGKVVMLDFWGDW